MSSYKPIDMSPVKDRSQEGNLKKKLNVLLLVFYICPL